MGGASSWTHGVQFVRLAFQNSMVSQLGGCTLYHWSGSPVGETDGTALDITIDTTSLATAFDPYVWVQDASGCVVGYSDDSFTCTYPPPSYECPSVSLDETEGGTYEVIVLMYGSCAGSVGEYEIVVEHDSDPKLTLVHDNVSRYDVLTIEASGTVVK